MALSKGREQKVLFHSGLIEELPAKTKKVFSILTHVGRVINPEVNTAQ